MSVSFGPSSYDAWTERDASITATKVKVRQASHETQQRGLFATRTIFPGERFLFIPSKSLIGEDMLKERGKAILDRQSQCAHSSDNHMSEKEVEELSIGIIEDLRRRITDPTNDSVVKMAAHSVQYEWRGDDGVALYLIACRTLLRQRRAQGSHESHDLDENILFTDAVPITDQLVLVDEEQHIHQHGIVDGDQCLITPAAVAIRTDESLTPDEPYTSYPSFLPHVEMLPESFPTNPLFFDEGELCRLEGTNCHAYVTRMYQQIQSDWAKLAEVLRFYHADPERRVRCEDCEDDKWNCKCKLWDVETTFTLDSYMWALSNIYSRSTDFRWHQADGEVQHRRVIAPLFDMMNHDFESDVQHAMDDEGNISVFNGSAKAIEAGSEICLNYGNFPNEKFLLVYGFVIPHNPFDAVQIYAPVPSCDPLYEAKTRILWTKCGLDDVNAPHALLDSHIDSGNILPASLLSVLRVVGIQSAEDLLSLASQEEGGTIYMISVENEFGALTALGQALHTMARHVALNLISDENLHGASNLSPIRPNTLPPITEFDESDSQPMPEEPTKADANNKLWKEDSLNLHSAKVLCQSEYRILQAALSEISERLNRLPKTTLVVSQ